MAELNTYSNGSFNVSSIVNVYQDGAWNSKDGFVWWNGAWHIFTKEYFKIYNSGNVSFNTSTYQLDSYTISANGDIYICATDKPVSFSSVRRILRYSKTGTLLNNVPYTVTNGSGGNDTIRELKYNYNDGLIYGITTTGRVVKINTTAQILSTGATTDTNMVTSDKLYFPSPSHFNGYIFIGNINTGRIKVINTSNMTTTNTIYFDGICTGITTAYNSSTGRTELYVSVNEGGTYTNPFMGETYLTIYQNLTSSTPYQKHYLFSGAGMGLLNVSGNLMISQTFANSYIDNWIISPTGSKIASYNTTWKGVNNHDTFVSDGTNFYTCSYDSSANNYVYYKFSGATGSIISSKTHSFGSNNIYLGNNNNSLFAFNMSPYAIYEFTDIQ